MTETTGRRVTDDGWTHDAATVRVAARASKAPGRGQSWRVTVADDPSAPWLTDGVDGEGRTVADAARDAAGKLAVMAAHAGDRPVIVFHADGTVTHHYWWHGTVVRDTVRDGHRVCSSSGRWESLDASADAAMAPGAYGPGVVIR
jgi:hypothetical protein